MKTIQSTAQSMQAQSSAKWSVNSIKDDLARLTGYDFSTASNAKTALLELFFEDHEGIDEILSLNFSKKESWIKLACFINKNWTIAENLLEQDSQPCTQLIYMIFQVQMKNFANHLRLQCYQFQYEFEELHEKDIPGFLALSQLVKRLGDESMFWEIFYLRKFWVIGDWNDVSEWDQRENLKLSNAINEIDEFYSTFVNPEFFQVFRISRYGKKFYAECAVFMDEEDNSFFHLIERSERISDYMRDGLPVCVYTIACGLE